MISNNKQGHNININIYNNNNNNNNSNNNNKNNTFLVRIEKNIWKIWKPCGHACIILGLFEISVQVCFLLSSSFIHLYLEQKIIYMVSMRKTLHLCFESTSFINQYGRVNFIAIKVYRLKVVTRECKITGSFTRLRDGEEEFIFQI